MKWLSCYRLYAHEASGAGDDVQCCQACQSAKRTVLFSVVCSFALDR